MDNQAIEANFDGIIGPTHNYSGLSYGNIASMKYKEAASNPKEAALQGLKKMQLLTKLGLKQGVIPPQERPYIPLLRSLGFQGDDRAILKQVAKEAPRLLTACSSSAAMWVANAATVSPSSDSSNGLVHFTPANLCSKLHRSFESQTTGRILQTIFPDPNYFIHHAPLPSGDALADEGAANHTRFCSNYGSSGIELFVYGRSTFDSYSSEPKRFPARQTDEASRSIARLHGLNPSQVIFAQQNPQAIDHGVFHNDVISVGNKNVFLFHELAFKETAAVIECIQAKMNGMIFLPVFEEQVSLTEAVGTYLFNSQLLSLSSGEMALIAPIECQESPAVSKYLNELSLRSNHPIKEIHYVNLKESMQNGGGPACLRLRVVLTEKELKAVNPHIWMNEQLFKTLEAWVQYHYRDRLLPADLADPELLKESNAALDELTKILHLGSIYAFQRI